MWIQPLNVKPYSYLNTKQSKIKYLELDEIRGLIRRNHRQTKELEPSVNKCQWIKNDGNVCCAKLKDKNKYCLRHMKMCIAQKEK